MRFLSVCSGISAASVAWRPLGWKAAAFAEIERFPSAVLAHHYSDTFNLGDITKFHAWPDPGTIDLLEGGTPCQSFSIAGLRAGLRDPRGNLALAFCALVDRSRPRWVVWENVPGVLSCDGGRAFGAFVGALGQLGYWWGYRSLDAQFFGVPQRRERVFVVGHSGGWRGPAKVLFERESLSGDSPPRRPEKQNVARPLTSGTRNSGGFRCSPEDAENLIMSHDPACTLTAREYKGPLPEADLSTVVAFNWQNGGGYGEPHDGLGISMDHTPPVSRSQVSAVTERKSGVRRLTPRECERLQGFFDDYTLVPYRGRPASDAPRYRALGNSMAVPVMAWIGRRIQLFEDGKL
jgi:DNA (cytosine-5)-methyltransferase 1